MLIIKKEMIRVDVQNKTRYKLRFLNINSQVLDVFMYHCPSKIKI